MSETLTFTSDPSARSSARSPSSSSPSAESGTSLGSDHVLPLSPAKASTGTLRSALFWKSYVVLFAVILTAALLGGWRGAAIGIALGTVLLFLGIRSILLPLAVMANAAQAMARGSYDHPISPLESDDAVIARLSQALSSLSGDLATRLRSIAEDRKRLETVLGATLEGVIAIDREGSVTLMNRAARRMLGLSAGLPPGRPLAETCGRQNLVNLAEEAIASGEVRTLELKEPGRTLEVYATPLNEGKGAVLVVHDVTEVRRLESVRRDFVANVSHELKTPLTSMKAYLETLLDGGLEDKENNLRFLHKIEMHVYRLSTLITDLLSLSKIESGDAFNQRLRVNLSELVLAAYQRLAPNAETKNLSMRIHLDPEPRHILGDTEALHQILDNLIDNAIKYTEPGGSIEVTVTRDGKRVRVDVQDTGVGIPTEDLPRIFERFYRVDKARSRELGGTGLGLSIVKHLVQALDGEIQVTSDVGKGSRFSVWFAEI